MLKRSWYNVSESSKLNAIISVLGLVLFLEICPLIFPVQTPSLVRLLATGQGLWIADNAPRKEMVWTFLFLLSCLSICGLSLLAFSNSKELMPAKMNTSADETIKNLKDINPNIGILVPATKKRAPPTSCNVTPLTSKRILVVDDVIDNRMLMERMLSKKGAEVSLATNGEEGFQKALGGHYDIIFMDIQMPVMDGYTATRRLRESGYKEPVIALTANAMEDDRDKCIAAGCSDYLTKPVNVNTLIETILNHTEKKAA